MGWNHKLATLCCSVALPGGLIQVVPAYASNSIPLRDFDDTALFASAVRSPSVLRTTQTPTPAINLPERSIPVLFSQTRLRQVPERPDEDFLQPLPTPQPVPPQTESPLTPTPPTPTPDTLPSDGTTFLLQRIEVTGSTIFSESDLAPITAPLEGQQVTIAQLQTIADQITQLYLDGGYITSRAVLVEQVIEDGVVQIRVIEGSLEAIEIEGDRRVNESYIRSRIRLGASTPLNQGQLEDQLRLLRIDPLFENVEASLRAGSSLGQSILSVRVVEAPGFYGEVSVDNYSPPSVGSERVGLLAGVRSPTGLGDDFSISYFRSTTGGSQVLDFVYRVPVNAMNGTLQLRAAPSDYEITDPEFAAFDIEGNADLYEISFRQPLIRTPREEFALSLGLTYRDGETLISGFQVDSSTTSVIRFGQDYVRRDSRGAWAVRSQFNLGTELFDATSDGEPDGQFLSWLGQLQRVQVLNPDNLLILQADVQLSADPLLSSQQFVIGGGQSLRGYRQNARLGDNGFRLSAEDRITLARNEAGASVLQVAPFAEAGAVWNDGNNPNDLPDQTFLAGIGVGFLWNPIPDLDLRLDFALPLVDLDDRGDNAQDDGIYFTVNYRL